jgi:hypothetical protein
MVPREIRSFLKWGLRILAYVGLGLGLYVGGYVMLMRPDVPAVTEEGRLAYRSSFWFAPSVRVTGGVTMICPAVSPLNVVFEPADNCWRRICGFISAIPENEPFANGQLDPGRIQKISVLLNPPGMLLAERYGDLGKCRRIEVGANGAAQELCEVLAGRHSVLAKDGCETTVAGTIEAVIDGGATVFLYFALCENSDVYVCHPESPAHDPGANGHGQNNLLPWLRKYALQTEGSAQGN